MSILPFWLDLPLSVGTDYSTTLTLLSPTLAQLGFPGATGELEVRVTPEDQTPLVVVTTSSTASGLLSFGVTFPSPSGLAATNSGTLQSMIAGSTLVQDFPNVATSVASITALAALATTGYSIGTIVFVTAASGTYFAWSPSDPSTPNGSTIVAGIGGNWLLAGTVTIDVSAAASDALLGIDRAIYDLVVTLASGQKVPITRGAVYAVQTVSQ